MLIKHIRWIWVNITLKITKTCHYNQIDERKRCAHTIYFINMHILLFWFLLLRFRYHFKHIHDLFTPIVWGCFTSIGAIILRPQKVLGHLLLRGLHGNHQIWNTIFRQPNVVAWWKFAWVYQISSSLRKPCYLKHNRYEIHVFIA